MLGNRSPVDRNVIKWGGEMSSNYWSSTTNANNTDNAWNVNFNNGNNNNKSNSYYVRVVRGGKCSLLSFEWVYRAYLDCRKRKRGTMNALHFEVGLLDRLSRLAIDLQKGTYQPSRSVCFVTTTPKLRVIFAADFRDRIVHHLVVRVLEKIWEPRFIFDSYASRKEKGTHGAVNRLQSFMRKVTRNGKKAAWMVQLDIRSFFMSIDKAILFDIFERGLSKTENLDAEALLYLLHRTIFHACQKNFVFKGNRAMLEKVPPHKSLLKIEPGKGLPIGNLTSQFFANVYLNELDQFVKHDLKCRFYIRYVDDFIILSDDPDQLAAWGLQIITFLDEALLLKLKAGWRIKRVSEGADFFGYIVRPRYILARNRVVNAMNRKLREHHASLVSRQVCKNGLVFQKMKMGAEGTHRLMQTIASYLGHFKHAESHRLIQQLFLKHVWLSDYFFVDEGNHIRKKLFHKKGFRFFKWQVAFFRSRLHGVVLLVQVGRFFELYDHDAVEAGKALGLSLCLTENVAQRHSGMTEKSAFRSDTTLKTGKRRMAVSAGFPLRSGKRYVAAILNRGRDVAVIREGGAGRFVRERYVDDLYRALPNTFNGMP